MSSEHITPLGHVTPLTGREMQCARCGHWYVEPRQFNNVHKENGRTIGVCPGCGMINDLTPLVPKHEIGDDK